MAFVYHSGNTGLGLKNLLINANGLVNQRGYVSGTATTSANQYTVDRWRVVTLGQNLTFTTTNGVTTFTAPAGGVEQIIENLNVIGGEYVISFTGTAVVSISQSTDNVTYTAVTPVSGKYTITGGKYVKVNFSGGTFSLPQFEKGTTATPFEQRPYGLELSLCQRYLSTSFQEGAVISQPDGLTVAQTGCTCQNDAFTQAGGQVDFPVTMRVAPTVSIYAPLSTPSVDRMRKSIDGVIFTGATAVFIGAKSFIPSGGDANNTFQFGYVASAEL